MNAKLILISGPCGSGKTSLSRLLAKGTEAPLSVHIHTDDFYQYIQKGYIPPWRDDSGDQNEAVVHAAAACAEQYVLGGYEAYVDGVVGPWFLRPWQKLAQGGVDVRYVVLRPGEQTAVDRAMGREQRAEFPLTEEAVRAMWRLFADLGPYEAHAVDTSTQAVEESAGLLRARLDRGEFRL